MCIRDSAQRQPDVQPVWHGNRRLQRHHLPPIPGGRTLFVLAISGLRSRGGCAMHPPLSLAVPFRSAVSNQPKPIAAPGILRSATAPPGRTPVSYTHLDVYKRQIQDYRSHMGRIDWNISSRDKIFGTAQRSRYLNQASNYFHDALSGTNADQIMFGAQIDEIHTFSPTLFSDVRGSITRYAVSYTHLDVYKRQALAGSLSRPTRCATGCVPN